MIWGFSFLSDTEQWIGNGGKTIESNGAHISIPQNKISTNWNKIDSVYNNTIANYGKYRTALVIFPEDDSDVINITVYPYQNAYHYDDYYFDQYTLKEVHARNDRYSQADGGEKLSRMNYDIHIGRIAGLPGRIAMFFASLICASLPITGFIIWFKRRKKKKK